METHPQTRRRHHRGTGARTCAAEPLQNGSIRCRRLEASRNHYHREIPQTCIATLYYILYVFSKSLPYIYIYSNVEHIYIYIYKNVLYWCINSISCLFNSPPCCLMLISFIHHFFPMIPFSLLAAHFLSSPMYFIYFSFSFRTSMAISAVCHGCYRNSGHCGHGRRFEHASKFRRACLSVMAWSLTHEERKSVTWCKLEQLVLYHDYLLTIFSGYNDVDIPFGIYHLYYHSGYTING